VSEGDAAAEAAGIRRLPIPTPFAVGRVNCYLVEDDPLTLLDTGPNSGKALDELEQALAALGHRVEDLGRIVVSHQHIDHIGLVSILARRSGAEVCALDLLAPVLEDFSGHAELDDELAEALMRRHGIPPDVVTALRAVSRAFRGWGAAAHVDRELAPGSVLEFRDRRLEVLHRPGHSPSDTTFWDAERRILLAGDHLIGHISSNPLLSRPLDGTVLAEGERPHALLAYMDSLRRTRAMPVGLVLPGHGDPVTGHAALIDERFAAHERRAGKIERLIAEAPRSAYEIAQALWGQVAVTQAYLTLSEVLGHVDVLLEAGRIREEAVDGVARFETVG
jgi:glyoxylase-like metal-dependent hydrolase (beta-lactamase superfamily II)